MNCIKKVKSQGRKNLSKKRYAHSKSCASMAVHICEHYGLLEESERTRIELAALYHDMYREVSIRKLLLHTQEISIPLTPEEQQWPSLLHAPVAAHHAGFHACLSDSAIVTAIRWHTLASPDMGMMGAVLYCADYMELERTYMTHKKVKSLLDAKRLEHLVKRVLEDHFEHSEKKRRDVAETTFNTYRYIIQGGRFR
ncbi:MAG: hypothetical protein JXK93_00240 [Sphaerochaetaceae bacterium]|nr:hypothetical protein [Sphaerochaetaceae bacterium]